MKIRHRSLTMRASPREVSVRGHRENWDGQTRSHQRAARVVAVCALHEDVHEDEVEGGCGGALTSATSTATGAADRRECTAFPRYRRRDLTTLDEPGGYLVAVSQDLKRATNPL